MEKRVFEEQEPIKEEVIQPKQEFIDAEIRVDTELLESTPEFSLNQTIKPTRWWIRLLMGAFLLLGIAIIAQSVQWLVDTWQNKQWIYFAFAVGFAGISLAGIGAIVGEWRKLRWLRKYHQEQQASEDLFNDISATSGQKATDFCKSALARLNHNAQIQQAGKQWQNQLDEAYNGKEVLYLFSQTVLSPIDRQVKTLISKSAIENAVIVAISPLAIIDVLMVAWRNIALVNKITQAYGMELGYFSRLRLFRMVLTNMAFAGATEIATDLGSDFLSQNLTAKFSVRMAQGIGVGLLTARLGIKAMEFCRPVVFQGKERPTLSVVRQELLGVLKNTLFSKSTEKEVEKV